MRLGHFGASLARTLWQVQSNQPRMSDEVLDCISLKQRSSAGDCAFQQWSTVVVEHAGTFCLLLCGKSKKGAWAQPKEIEAELKKCKRKGWYNCCHMNTKSSQTVAISYGFAEGTWHGIELRKTLQEEGYEISKNLQSADIIIAHSAGSYAVPSDVQAHTVLHVGYTYTPGNSIARSIKQTMRLDKQHYGLTTWAQSSIVQAFYMLNVRKSWRACQDTKDTGYYLDRLATGPRHIFIRNLHDSYCNPEALLERSDSKYAYISLPRGTHNDIWYSPKPYVALLQSMYKER
jgi:hypothetical protein